MLWPELVKNKRILVLSNNNDEINKQRPLLGNIYDSDIFEGCDIITCNLPNHTKGDNVSLTQYLNAYFSFMSKNVGEMMSNIDMVLIGGTPHNIFIINYFCQYGKTILDIGEYLELFFGIYTDETLERYGDFINLYKNKHWIKA